VPTTPLPEKEMGTGEIRKEERGGVERDKECEETKIRKGSGKQKGRRVGRIGENEGNGRKKMRRQENGK